MCTPALRHLRNSMIESRITFLANSIAQQILENCPWADDWIIYNKHDGKTQAIIKKLRESDFDAAILLSNSFRSAMLLLPAGIKERIGYARDGRSLLLTRAIPVLRIDKRFAPMSMVQYYNRLVECESDETNDRLELFTSKKDKLEVDELLQKWNLQQDDRLVIIVPGGAFGGSKWWPTERFAKLADKLIEDGYKVIVSCAPNGTERNIAEQIARQTNRDIYNLIEAGLSLSGLKELIQRCCLMVSNDTGPCHIAAALAVPLVTIFGPTDPRWTVTGYAGETRLRVDVDCGPCQQETCSKDHRCMNLISVDDVYSAAKKRLGGDLSEAADNFVFGSYYEVYNESFVPLRDGSGLVHQDYKKLLEQNGLGGLDDVFAFENGQKLHKAGLGVRQRFRVELSATGGEKHVVYLKRFGRGKLVELVKRWITRRSMDGAGMYDFAAGVELAEKGIAVGRPIAYGQELGRLGEKRSFAVIEELPQAEALERLLPKWKEKQRQYDLLRDRKELIRQTARLAGRLHNSGYYHRDLYLAHIFLCRDRQDVERLCLIDLQRVFRPIAFAQRWKVKDLAQLYYSSRAYFSRADVVRFLHEYFHARHLDNKHKRLIKAVYRKVNRIAQHDKKKRMRQKQTIQG